MKKLSAIIIALLMLAACFAGCGDKKPADTAEAQPTEAYGVYHDYFSKPPTTLNSMVDTDTPCSTIGGWTRASFYSKRPTEDREHCEWWCNLAADWPQKMDEEGKVWRVTMRDDVKWENGETLNIDDYIYSVQMLVDPIQLNVSSTNLTANVYGKIVNISAYSKGECSWEDVGMKKIDDLTVEYTFEYGIPQINVQRIANSGMIVYRPYYEGGLSEDKSVTNYGTSLDTYMSFGPFKLVEWIPDAKFTMVRNEYYPHQEHLHIEGVDYKVVPDGETALQLFMKGELDYCDLTYTDWEKFEDDPRVYEYFNDSLMYAFVNLGNPSQNNILGSLDYRKALSHGADRVELANTMGVYPVSRYIRRSVIGNALTDEPFVEIPADYVADPATLYNPELAREYLAKAFEEKGLTNATVEFLQAETATFNKAVNEMLQKQYDTVFEGKLKANIRQVPTTIKLRRWNPDDPTSYEISIGSMLPSAEDPRASFKAFTSDYNPPRVKWENKEFDEAYAESMVLDLYDENNTQKIIELCQKMEKLMLDDLVIIPLYERQNKVLYAERIHLPVDNYVIGLGFGNEYMTISK